MPSHGPGEVPELGGREGPPQAGGPASVTGPEPLVFLVFMALHRRHAGKRN